MKPERTTFRVWMIARRVPLFLTLGAVVNVGVAWWGAAMMPFWDNSHHRPTEIGPWPIDVPEDWPPSVDGIANEWALVTWIMVAGEERHSTGHNRFAPNHNVTVFEAGWPMRSMRTWIMSAPPYEITDERDYEMTMGVDAAKVVPFFKNRRRLPIPLLPIPLGFTLNTLFYAALLYVPVLGFGALKCRQRARRGLCPACAYDLAGMTTCPECGSAPSPRRGEEVDAADR